MANAHLSVLVERLLPVTPAASATTSTTIVLLEDAAVRSQNAVLVRGNRCVMQPVIPVLANLAVDEHVVDDIIHRLVHGLVVVIENLTIGVTDLASHLAAVHEFHVREDAVRHFMRDDEYPFLQVEGEEGTRLS